MAKREMAQKTGSGATVCYGAQLRHMSDSIPMGKPRRRNIPQSVIDELLVACRRRCALCFGLRADRAKKRGQVAHIDHDHANAAAGNLVYLCLDHHDEYDSRPSQSKGLTEGEVRRYRAKLIEAVASMGGPELPLLGRSIGSPSPTSLRDARDASRGEAARAHDIKLFEAADAVLPEAHLMGVIDRLQTSDDYHLGHMRRLDRFVEHSSTAGARYLDDEVALRCGTLVAALQELRCFNVVNFFVYGELPTGSSDDVRLCLQPEWNVDRHASVAAADSAKYLALQRQLDERCTAVRSAYAAYRSAVKTRLLA